MMATELSLKLRKTKVKTVIGVETGKILLISNSTVYGRGYLDHVENEIRDFLGPLKKVLFVPFALYDRDAYALLARRRFAEIGYELTSVHEAKDTEQAINDSEAVFIGGG